MQLFILVILFVSITFSQSEVIKINNLSVNKTYEKSFYISKKSTLTFSAIAPQLGREERSSSIWILNSETREIVWELEDATSNRSNRRGIREFNDSFSLQKGSYQIYFTTITDNIVFNGKSGILQSLADIFEGIRVKGSMKSKDVRLLEMTLKGKHLEKITGRVRTFKNRFVLFQKKKMKRNYYKKIAFELEKDMKLHIYAMGEVLKNYGADYFWIKNIDTHQKVWELNYRKSEHAGGGRKNRMFNDDVEFDEGRYVLTIVSDDSHHYSDWNVAPPYDPEFWGITITSKKKYKNYIKFIEDQKIVEKNVLLKITEVRNHEYITKGLLVKREIKIKIMALGEGNDRSSRRGTYSSFADAGWIKDMATGKTIWSMEEKESEHAGGATKNRIVYDEITLKKGKYLISYQTDDSHAFSGWNSNSSAPINPELWGITISSLKEKDGKYVSEFEPYKLENVLVKIIRVRDDEKETIRFHLDKETELSIYAIGESDSREMVDYGFITKKNGRRIWRMRYRNTEHAGGSKKNRLIHDAITLKAGDYELHYISDGSHSYRDWNEDAPHDKRNYGITLYNYEN